jgi:hypothetical protein
MSLLPPRSAAEPRPVPPSTAPSLPSPLENTTKRSSRVLLETRSTSGAYTLSVGAGSLVGAAIGVPITCAPGGGSVGAAGVFRSTLTLPLTVNSRPSRPRLSFGSDRYALGLPAHVFQGTVIDAVDPETDSGWATAVFVFA